MPQTYFRYLETFPGTAGLPRLTFKAFVDLGYWHEADRRLERVIERGRPVRDWLAFIFYVNEHYRRIRERELFWGDENEGENAY